MNFCFGIVKLVNKIILNLLNYLSLIYYFIFDFYYKLGKQITVPTKVRDIEWSTFSCPFGWPVQGIWSSNNSNCININSVDRSPNGKYLMTGDNFNKVNLFKYPCPRDNSLYKTYKGHAENVTSVRFSNDGNYCFSVGGLDKAIFQFEIKVDPTKKDKIKA